MEDLLGLNKQALIIKNKISMKLQTVKKEKTITETFIRDLNLQIDNRTKNKKNTKLKDKISSYFFKLFLVCLISSYFHCLLPRFKGSRTVQIH